jgi:hypothetical protein
VRKSKVKQSHSAEHSD